MTENESGARQDSGKRRPWKWIVLTVVICVAGLVFYRVWGSLAKKPEKRAGRGEIPVQVVPAVQKPFSYALKATGDIAAFTQVDLYPKVSGYLERIYVNFGDAVRQGQVIAKIEQTEFLQKVRETEAKVAQARAQLTELETGTRQEDIRQSEEALRQARSRYQNARLQRERIDALFKRQVISKKEADVAEMEATVAEAQVASAEQQLKQLREGARQEVKDASQARLRESEAILAQERTRLQWTQITAPFAGEISKRYVDNGSLLSTTTPVVTLAQTDTLKVMASVLEKDVPLLKIGMKAKIQAEAYPDKVFEGKVSRLNSALDLATRTLLAEITVPNPGRVLKPGMFAKIEVTLVEKPRTLVVPREAVIESEKDRVVFVVEENLAVRKRVTLGYEQGDVIEVTGGLKEGDRVIIRGQLSVKDRSPVKIIEGG